MAIGGGGGGGVGFSDSAHRRRAAYPKCIIG